MISINSLYFSIHFSQAKSYLSIKGVFLICTVSSANCVNDALMVHRAFSIWFLSLDLSSTCHSASSAFMRLIFSLVIPLFFLIHCMMSFNTYLFFYYHRIISACMIFCSTKKLFTNSFRPSILSFWILTIFSWSLMS